MDNINIIINALLDMNKTSTNINIQTKELQSKLQPLNLSMGIDKRSLEQIYDIHGKLQKVIATTTDQYGRITKETYKWDKDANQLILAQEKIKTGNDIEIQQQKQKQKQLNEIHKKFKELSKESVQYQKEIDKVYQQSIAQQSKIVRPNTLIQQKIEDTTGITVFNQRNIRSAKEYQSVWDNIGKEIKRATLEQDKLVESTKRLNYQTQSRLSQSKYNSTNRSFFNNGVFDTDRFNKSLGIGNTTGINAQNSALVELFDKTDKGYKGFSKLEEQVVKTNKSMKNLSHTTEKSAQSFGNVLYKIGLWGLATSAVYMPLRQFREGIETLKELDTQLVEINKVTDLSAIAMARLAKESFSVASSFGRTSSDYLSGVAEFSRAGYDGQRAEDLSQIALLSQNVGELTSEQANQFLLATDAAYKYKGSQEQLMKVLDGANQIDNKFATSIEKISSGMTRAGSIASNAGVEVDQLASVIGTMTAVTQRSGAEAGNAFKGILMNIRQVKGGLEDGEVIDDESISKSAKALANVGIQVHELRNGIEELRNPMDVLKELANKWETLSTIEQSQLIDSIGGKYRGNYLTAILENFSTYEQMLSEYASSAGSAMRENEIRMDSWQTKANQLKNTISEFWYDTLDTDMFKSMIDSTNILIQTLDKLVNNPMAKFVMVAGLGALSGKALALAFTAITTGAKGESIALFIKDLQVAIATEGVLTGVTKTLSATLLASPLFWGAIAVSSIYAVYKAVDYLTVSFEEQKKIVEDLNSEIDSLQSEYEQLSTKNFLTSEEQKKLDILKEQLDTKRKIVALEQQEANKKYIAEYTAEVNNRTATKASVYSDSSELSKTNQSLEKYSENLEKIQEINNAINKTTDPKGLKSLEEQLQSLTLSTEKTKTSLLDIYNAMTEVKNNGAEFPKEMERQYRALGKALGLTKQEATDSKTVMANLASSEEYLITVTKKMNEGHALTKKEMQKLVDTYPDLAKAVRGANDEWFVEIDALGEVKNASKEFALSQINDQIKQTETTIKNTNARIKAIIAESEAYQQMQAIKNNVYSNNFADLTLGKNKELKTGNNFADLMLGKTAIPSAKSVSQDATKTKEQKKAEKILKDNEIKLKELQALANKLNNEISSGSGIQGDLNLGTDKGSKSSTPSAISHIDETQAIINTINKQVILDKIQNDYLEKQIKIAENAKDYAKQIELQNQLLSNQQKTISDLKLANDQIHAQADLVRTKTKYNTESWFNADNSDTTSYIALLNSFEGKTDEASKKVVENIKNIHDKIKTLKDGWISNKGAIDNMNMSIQTTVNTINDLKIKALEAQKDALQKIIDLTVELIKKEKEDTKQAIQDKINTYKNYIDLQKESLELLEREKSYNETVDEKTDLIAKLQKQADTLSLDDSKEAQAKRVDILEQIQEKQKDLNKFQHDDAVEKQQSALDKQLKSFENEKEEEIKEIENYLKKTGQLTRDAMRRIDNDGYSLYQDLINYNNEYGEKLESEIVSAWESATKALEQYGSTLNAITNMNTVISTSKTTSTSIDSSSSKADVKAQMQANSKAWFNADKEERKRLSAQNDNLGASINAYKDYSSGKWYTDYTKKTPLYHNGLEAGFVGGNIPVSLKQNELFALLEEGELVFNKEQQEKLFDIVNLSKNIVPPISNNFDKLQNSNARLTLKVEAPVTIEGNADSNTIKQLEKFGDSLVNKTITKLNDSFNLRGLTSF